ncbi:hypothetical protein [Daejeonella sp.]|uniref:hypothetical protein n=1 Tax=Daejeonella sp. TaxID=2805397 RepID=UPI0025C117CB|nr:hypothetical protein [Daejeonella sp.]
MQKVPLIIVFVFFFLCNSAKAQKFYLGNYLTPTENEFQLLGISSKSNVYRYKYKKEIYDNFYNRKIGEIIVGIKNGYIVQTIYYLIPKSTDVGVPQDIIDLIQSNIPYKLGYNNGVYGMNIDNESISIARLNNSITFNKDRIMINNSVKQSILEKTGN